MLKAQKTRGENDQNDDQGDLAQRQRYGGNRRWSEKQHGERIFQSAGQIEQGRKLQDIKGQKRGRGSI